MDPLDVLIINARGQLGCSGLRNLRDLAQMRQETIEKRFTGAQHLLTVRNTLSIYAAWLWAKAFYEPPKDLHRVMEKWCAYLWGIGCTREMARIAWTEAQVMLGPMSVTESSPLGALHMKIGSSITMQFPTASLNKRKISVLQECASHEKQAIKKTTHQEAPLPSAKKHKTSHVSRIILPGSPFRQTVHVCFPSVHASRQGFLSLSPDNKDLRSHSSQNAARRAQEEGEVSRGLAGFHFHFGHNASRPSVGGSHWSPRQDVARDSQRRGENRSASQIHRWPAPSRVEERIPMSPPWAVSVRHPIAPPVPPKQKQTQKQRQINNIQNQLIKHENASVSQKKASEASKKPRGPTKDVPVAKAGQSSIAKFGALAAEANTQSTRSSIIRHEDESGRLSPWEEDEYVIEIPRQATSTVVQAKLSNSPLPMKPASVGNTSGATKKVSLGHFGTPKGILKPDNKKDRPPHQSCIPSAPALPAQQNVQHHAQSHFQHQAPIHPHYTQHHLPHLTQHHALNPNDPGVRVAPYPRMHSSPLSQHPILLQQQQRGAYKPLIGYHPGVTRLFRRRPNVWVHQMSRDVALDTWGDFSYSNPPQEYSSWVHQVTRDFALKTRGDFSDSNQPQEYWAWEEYDPLNPLV